MIIFVFIFVGINAFAIPGTFGSIINSMFPIGCGFGLNGKNKKRKEILKMDTIKLKSIIT